jgi:hypothetical protein
VATEEKHRPFGSATVSVSRNTMRDANRRIGEQSGSSKFCESGYWTPSRVDAAFGGLRVWFAHAVR